MTSSVLANDRRRFLSYVALCASSFCMYGVNNVLMAIAPTFVTDLGYSMALAGLQGTVFLVAAIAIRFAFTPLFGIWGSKPFLFFGAISFCIATAVMLFVPSFEWFMIGRIVQAIGLAVYWPCASEAVIAISPESKTGRYLGFYRLITKLSLTVGPALAFGVMNARGYEMVFGCLAALSILAGLLILAAVPSANKPLSKGVSADSHTNEKGVSEQRQGHLHDAKHEENPVTADAKTVFLLLATTAIGSLGYGIVMTYSPSFINSVNPNWNEGSFLTFFSLGCIVASPLVGMMTDKISWRKLLPACLLLLSVGIGGISMLSTNVVLLIASGVIAGLGSSGGTICILQGIAQTTEGRKRATLISHQQNCVDISIAAASAIFGYLLALPFDDSCVFFGWAIVSGIMGAAVACIPAARRR